GQEGFGAESGISVRSLGRMPSLMALVPCGLMNLDPERARMMGTSVVMKNLREMNGNRWPSPRADTSADSTMRPRPGRRVRPGNAAIRVRQALSRVVSQHFQARCTPGHAASPTPQDTPALSSPGHRTGAAVPAVHDRALDGAVRPQPFGARPGRHGRARLGGQPGTGLHQAPAPAFVVHAPGHGAPGPARVAALPDGADLLGAGIVVCMETGPRHHHAAAGADCHAAGLGHRLFLAARHDLQPQYSAALVDCRLDLAAAPSRACGHRAAHGAAARSRRQSTRAALLHRALRGGRTRDWVLLGIVSGLAMLTKYSALIQFAAFFLYMLRSGALRRPDTWRGIAIAALAFLVVLGPHLWWLDQHRFEPLHYADASLQTNGRLAALKELLRSALDRAGRLATRALVLAGWALWRRRRGDRAPGHAANDELCAGAGPAPRCSHDLAAEDRQFPRCVAQ